MELYFKFMTTLTFGLVGTGMVLKVLLDELFMEWDAVADFKEWSKSLQHRRILGQERREDTLLDEEKARTITVNTRMIDERREVLKQLSAVERRLDLKDQNIVLTPLARTPVDTVSPQS